MAVPYHIERKTSRFNPIAILKILLVGIIMGGSLSIAIRWILYTPVLIETRSMEPTLAYGESYMLRKSTSDLLVGEIVLCVRESGDIVSRILGRPGDRIRIQDKTIFRNGDPIPSNLYSVQFKDERPPLPSSFSGRDNLSETRVPENHYFLVGDNRDEALDSRILGAVPQECILGRFSGRN